MTHAMTYILKNGRVVDPANGRDGVFDIEVRDGVIARVAPDLPVPDGVTVLEVPADCVVTPGLIDMHVHLYSEGDPLKARLEGQRRDFEDGVLIAARHARMTLEAGFTTVRDLGGEARGVVTLRDFINAGELPGPTIVPPDG